MKKSIAPFLVLLLLAGACKGREGRGANGEPTETIAPAAPQPAPTDTEALTQTVDIGDGAGGELGRSEAEGAVLTNPNPAAGTVTGTAGTATTATTGTTTQTTTR